MSGFQRGFKTYAELRRWKQHVPYGDPYISYSAFDSFTRADSTTTPGSATEKGGAWTVVAGTFGITGNKLYCNGATGSATLGSMPTGNGTYQATYTSDDWSNHPIQTMLRRVDANSYLLFAITSAAGAGIRFTTTGGTGTSFAAITPTTLVVGTPSTFRVTLAGTTFTVVQDGLQIATGTLTGGAAAIAGTGCGVYMNGSGNTTATNVDDYSVLPA